MVFYSLSLSHFFSVSQVYINSIRWYARKTVNKYACFDSIASPRLLRAAGSANIRYDMIIRCAFLSDSEMVEHKIFPCERGFCALCLISFLSLSILRFHFSMYVSMLCRLQIYLRIYFLFHLQRLILFIVLLK